MRIVWMPLAWYGGRSWDELHDREAGDCDTSIAVGMMGVVSIGIILAGHALFWGHLPHTAGQSWVIAVSIALLFALLYRVLLRAMETMGLLAKTVTLAVLVSVMGVNAALAGHELVLLAFRPQVESQAKLSAALGVTTYATAVEQSLGLPQLRTQSQQLDTAIGAAQAERLRIPEGVEVLQRQGLACDSLAAQLRARIPSDASMPGHAAAASAWREQRARCGALNAQARRMLAEHRARVDQQLGDLNQQQARARQSLSEANAQHEETLQRDAPTLTASATTGFARHAALWAAVDAGRIPAWAAYGMMFVVLALDAFSFLIKLVAKHDTATAERRAGDEAGALFNQLRSATLAQQRRQVRQAVHAMEEHTLDELRTLLQGAVAPAVAQDLEARAFEQAAQATHRAQQRSRQAAPSLIRRLAAMAGHLRRGAGMPGGPFAGRAAPAGP